MVYTYMQGDEMQSLVREEPLTPQHTTTIRVHAPDNVCLLLYTGKPFNNFSWKAHTIIMMCLVKIIKQSDFDNFTMVF